MTPDGAVRAMVGGRDYAESQYNRAGRKAPARLGVQAVRLSHRDGSRVYTGDDPSDAPLDVKGWKPENYSHEYLAR